MKQTTWIIITLVLVIALITQRACVKSDPGETVYITDTIIKQPAVIYPDTFYTPPITNTVIVYKPANIDTAAVLAAFYDKNTTIDTIVNDSNALVIITDTVFQNKIISRWPEVTIYPRLQVRQIKAEAPKSQIYAGFSLQTNGISAGLSPTILLKTKRDQIYFAGYDIFNKNIQIGMLWKIKFK